MSLGVLTLATATDYRKAIGLALSVRISNPDVPVAVACEASVRVLVAPFFDHVVVQDPALKGFMHKLYLDRYSPFDETFFFDSDVLVFRPLKQVLNSWGTQPYTACGNFGTTGFSSFGLDRERVLKLIAKESLVQIDGAGHAYFRQPECKIVFDLAREIAANYEYYAGKIRLADEDVIDIAMTILNLQPMPHFDFWARPLSGKPGSIRMEAAEGRCSLILVDNGLNQHPYMIHFAAKEAAFLYERQLRRLFKKFGVSTKGLLRMALSDFYFREIKWPLKGYLDRLKVRRTP
jgi:hypothetical protein